MEESPTTGVEKRGRAVRCKDVRQPSICVTDASGTNPWPEKDSIVSRDKDCSACVSDRHPALVDGSLLVQSEASIFN